MENNSHCYHISIITLRLISDNEFYRTGWNESGHPHDHTGLYRIHWTEVLAFIAPDADIFIINKGLFAIHFKNTHHTLIDAILTPIAE
jgi:hypothetical protein